MEIKIKIESRLYYLDIIAYHRDLYIFPTLGSPTKGQMTQGHRGSNDKGSNETGSNDKGSKARQRVKRHRVKKMQQRGKFFFLILTSVTVSIYLLLFRVRLG